MRKFMMSCALIIAGQNTKRDVGRKVQRENIQAGKVSSMHIFYIYFLKFSLNTRTLARVFFLFNKYSLLSIALILYLNNIYKLCTKYLFQFLIF